ncbi:MAG: tetratricopeptide repeat protein, partial [Candidatus Heimdallarchaeota archaeon]|nr:tetratricopeptide repeat protein [Candidatus Heimdallarchaeota archaeon]
MSEGKLEIEAKIAKYLRLLEQDPNNVENHFKLGTLYLDEDQHQLALIHFENVLKLNPEDTYSMINL